jgi:hypothetical protein
VIAIIPLMIFPFLIYNLALWGFLGSQGTGLFQDGILTLHMMSGAIWRMSAGDLLICGSLIILFIEILKATRRSALSVVDHILSILLFIAFLIEFLLVKDAANQVFFILMMIAFIDVVAGFSISIRSASRDVSIGL